MSDAADGFEALTIVRRQRLALVLLDLAMPRLGGHETIPYILNVDPSIRIVVITGCASEEMRHEVERLGQLITA